MKMLRWKFPRLCGLTGALVACGYLTSSAWAQQNGNFGSQPLVNAGPKPKASSSWLPKLPFTGPAKPTLKAPSSSADEAPAQDAAKGKAKEPADLMSLARLNERRGQPDLAKQMYKKELERNPNNGKAFHRLAVMSAKDEQWEEANGYFMRAEQLMPNESELLADMGYALYLQHRLEPSEAYLRRAVKISPRNEAAYNNLGIVLGVQGKFDEAFAAFQRVGTAAEAHTNMSYVHTQLGDVDQAMQHLSQALTLDPNLKVAAIALMQLNDIKKRFSPKDEPLQLAEGKDAATDAAKGTAKDAVNDAPAKAAVPSPSAVSSATPSSSPRQASGRAVGDRVAEIVERPSKPASVGASLAAESTNQRADSANRPIPSIERRPLPTVSVAPPPHQTVAPARSVAELSPATEPSTPAERKPVENKYVAANAKPSGDASPVGKPPREVAARPLPGKSKDAGQAATDAAPSLSFDRLPATGGEVARVAEPPAEDATRNVSATALATGRKPPIAAASASVAIHKEKPLVPPPADKLAPIVSPSERMQQLRAKQRAEAAERKQLPQPVHSRPAGNAASDKNATTGISAKDANLLSLLPSMAAGMIPSVPQAANDSANPATMLPTRQPSMAIPRVEDMMPPDAMVYQAPTSALHPAAQSLWSSSNQPLRYLTDQSGLSALRPGEASAGGAASAAGGRSGSLGGPTAPRASATQPSGRSLPRTY